MLQKLSVLDILTVYNAVYKIHKKWITVYYIIELQCMCVNSHFNIS